MIKIIILVMLVTLRLNYHPSTAQIAPFAEPSGQFSELSIAAQQTARLTLFEEFYDRDAFENEIYRFYKLVNSKSSFCRIQVTGNAYNTGFASSETTYN